MGGFTLVELLAVVGIIAVLIGILLPALMHARDAARTTVCLANLRSVGQGLGLYRAKYSNLMPPIYLSHPDLAPPSPRWESGFQYGSRSSGACTWNWADVLIAEEFITRAVVDCPSSDGTGKIGSTGQVETDRAIEYAMNGYVGTESGRLIGLKTEPSAETGLNYDPMTLDRNWSMFRAWPFARISRPSEGLCVVDSEAPGMAWPIVTATFSDYTPRKLRHRSRRAINILFFDGHVETREPAMITSPRDAIFDNQAFSGSVLPGSLYFYNKTGSQPIDYHHQKLREKMPTALWRPWKPYF